LAEKQIQLRLMITGALFGLEAPETEQLLALRVAVRRGQLEPLGYHSTTQRADLWVDQQMALMKQADPLTVSQWAAPERAAIEAAMADDKINFRQSPLFRGVHFTAVDPQVAKLNRLLRSR